MAVVLTLVPGFRVSPSPTVAPSSTVSETQLPSVPPIPPSRLMSFPPLSGPSRTFIFDSELSYRVSDYTRESRFVLYDNGAFVLQYPPSGYGEVGFLEHDHDAKRGPHVPVRVINGPESARAKARRWCLVSQGDLLTIRYQENMHHSDFEDAVYVLIRGRSDLSATPNTSDR